MLILQFWSASVLVNASFEPAFRRQRGLILYESAHTVSVTNRQSDSSLSLQVRRCACISTGRSTVATHWTENMRREVTNQNEAIVFDEPTNSVRKQITAPQPVRRKDKTRKRGQKSPILTPG